MTNVMAIETVILVGESKFLTTSALPMNVAMTPTYKRQKRGMPVMCSMISAMPNGVMISFPNEWVPRVRLLNQGPLP